MEISSISDLKQVLDLYSTQYSATDKLWSYFSSITLAVLGFSIASEKVSKSLLETSIVVCGYLVFCIGNFKALILSHHQLIEFSNLAQSVSMKHNIPLITLQPYAPDSITTFYWSVAISVCLGILTITWKRNKKTVPQPKATNP